ncbi:TonB family protein [Petrachloros mirabilis]
MVTPAQVESALWFDQEEQERFFARLGRTLTISLILHLVVLLVVAGLRLAPRGERPLASVEVSLVSTPAPLKEVQQSKRLPVKRAESKPIPPKIQAPPPSPQAKARIEEPAATPPPSPARMVEPTVKPAPAPPARMVEPMVRPAPAPRVRAVAPAPIPLPAPPRTKMAKDILRDLQLPPDAPKLGELTPAKATGQPQPKSRTKIKLPDLPPIPDNLPEQKVAALPRPLERSAVSDDLDRELEEELKKVKKFVPAAKLEIPKEEPRPLTPPPPMTQEASIPQVKAPQTQLKTSGSSGTNPYWARIESIIKKHWEPPPIDVTGQTYSVVVKFRFFRNGTVKDVGIQQTSGNSYFDMAGQRAILKPRVFPPFPAEMSEAYQDVEMVFRVGETVG